MGKRSESGSPKPRKIGDEVEVKGGGPHASIVGSLGTSKRIVDTSENLQHFRVNIQNMCGGCTPHVLKWTNNGFLPEYTSYDIFLWSAFV